MMKSRAWWRNPRLLLILIVAFAIPFPALALLVRPVLLDLTSTGSNASGSLEVINDRNRPVAVEVTVKKLSLPERGDPVLTPDDGSNFQIFPPIASIAPGARQVFRVRWVGNPTPAESQLYMFSTSELPVAARPNETTVQVLYAINSVVAVRAPDAKPNIAIESIVRATRPDSKTGESKSGVEITFSNTGPAHGFVTRSALELRDDSAKWSHTFEPSDLNNAFGLGLVPANAKRVMFLPIAELPPAGDLSADMRAPAVS
jgi:fimbrial chaperone protein